MFLQAPSVFGLYPIWICGSPISKYNEMELNENTDQFDEFSSFILICIEHAMLSL